MGCEFIMQFSKIPIFYYWYSSANSVEFFKRSGRRRAVFCSAMRFWGARCGTPRRYEDRLRHPHRRRGPLNATRRFLIVPRRDKDHPRQHGHAGHHHGEGRHPIGCAHMGGANGRGNLRENREDPAPTVGIAVISLRIAPKGRPLVSPCAYHAHPACLPSMGPYGFYNAAVPNRDAARHVATNALPPYAHARPTATMRVPCHTWRPRFL